MTVKTLDRLDGKWWRVEFQSGHTVKVREEHADGAISKARAKAEVITPLLEGKI